MAVELGVAVEFARWFEWLSAADPVAARELVAAVDEYAAQVEMEHRVAFDMCSSPSGQLAFVAAHAGGEVFLASGAEVVGSPRRTMLLVSRARTVVRRMRQDRVELLRWAEVRRSLRA
ncbi:MAG TPA: hypothetical protein VIG99_28510 [Myxococcaceae bacterium]